MRNGFQSNMNMKGNAMTAREQGVSGQKTVAAVPSRPTRPEDREETELAAVWARSRFHLMGKGAGEVKEDG